MHRILLLQNNVMIQSNGVYHWNEKIPVSAKLINKFRADYNELIKQIKQNKQIQTNEKRLKSKNKVEFIDVIEKNEIGIIRKFLKWLW